MNETFRYPTSDQSEAWVKNDAKLLEQGQATHEHGQFMITDGSLLDAIYRQMQHETQSVPCGKEHLTVDEQLVETFTSVFGDKVEAYDQQMWNVTRPMIDSGEFSDDQARPVDFSQHEALIQLRLNGVAVEDDLYARYIILPTNGDSMLVYSIRNANLVMGRVNRGARIYGEETKISVKARVGYLFPKDDEGSVQLSAKLNELKGLRSGDEYFTDASDQQKVAVLNYLEQLQQGTTEFKIEPGTYCRPKHSETDVRLA